MATKAKTKAIPGVHIWYDHQAARAVYDTQQKAQFTLGKGRPICLLGIDRADPATAGDLAAIRGARGRVFRLQKVKGVVQPISPSAARAHLADITGALKRDCIDLQHLGDQVSDLDGAINLAANIAGGMVVTWESARELIGQLDGEGLIWVAEGDPGGD